MGNQSSYVLGSPSDELKFKSGVKSESVPSPFGPKASTFEKLVSSPEFKNYLLSNLESSYFLSSVVNKSDDESVLLQGIHHFQNLNPDHRAATVASIKQFQRMSTAGICANVTENVSLCEKDLEIRSELQASPFTKYFQYRLAAIRNLSTLVAKEKELQLDELHPPILVESTVNTRTTAELYYLLPLHNAGFGLLDLVATFYPVTTDPNHRLLLSKQLDQFCNEFKTVPSLSLFSSWSPTAMSPLRAAELDKKSAKASQGDADKPLDGSSHTCWSVAGSRGEWSVDLVEPTSVVRIRIAWSSSITASSSSPSGAPLQLKVLCKRESKSFYELVSSVDMEESKRKHPTWLHSYLINADDVKSIKLVLSGTRSSKSPIKMYSFEALCEDIDARSVQTLRSLKKIQSKLVPLIGIDGIMNSVLDTLPVVARVSGSLEVTLEMIRFIRSNGLDEKMRIYGFKELYSLVEALYTEEVEIKDGLKGSDSNSEVVLTDVVFDETNRSSGIELLESGMMASSTTGGSNSYAMLTCIMETGIWEWEVTLVKENHGDETSCLGLARRPVTNASYETSEDMWLIRCYNGESYHGGKTGKKATPTIHPTDICRFTYDTMAQSVTLTVNEVDLGIVFENVPPGVSPCVAFYGSGKTVRVLSVKRRGVAAKIAGISDDSKTDIYSISSSRYYAVETELPTVQQLFGLPYHDSTIESKEDDDVKEEKSAEPAMVALLPSTMLLKRVSRLARLRSIIFQKAIDKEIPPASHTLEYPFAVQVTNNSFEQLMDLLSTCEDVLNVDQKSITLSCLHIIEAQFSCLTYSKVDPQAIGLGAVRGKSCNKLLYALASRLRILIGSSDHDVKKAAAEAFSRGIPYIFPHIAGRVEFALSIMKELKSCSGDNLMDVSKMVLLKAIIRRLSRYSETLQILNLFKKDSTWRDHINGLIFALVDMITDFTVYSKLKAPNAAVSGKVLTDDEELRANILSMLKKYQEQIVYELAAADMQDISTNYTYRCTVNIVLCYATKLLTSGTEVLKIMVSAKSLQHRLDIGELPVSDILFTELVSPVIHSFCLCSHHPAFVTGILPIATRVLRYLSDIVSESVKCLSAQKLLCQKVSSRTGSSSFSDNLTEGWKTINAVFEETDSSYAISDAGVVYTSVQASNTCALVNVGFCSPQKAAWEFLLENDTNNDECAVFGASTIPVVSRCYSSSSNLWMRRSYNGYLYAQGRSTGQTLDKIHPQDQVRVEFDGKAGTISYSVNGGPMELAFSGLTGEIHPCVGSYRTGVKVRLLKVEIFGSGNEIVSGMKEDDRPPAEVHWEIDDELIQPGKKPDVLSPNKSLALNLLPASVAVKEKNDLAAKLLTWVTARGDRGASFGVHEWSFEIMDRSKTPMSFGVVFGGKPYSFDRLGGPCLGPGPVERVLAQTKKGARYYCGKKGVSYYSNGASGWHTRIDGTCACDGTCGPTNGCQCDECYRASFPAEFNTEAAATSAVSAEIPTGTNETNTISGDVAITVVPPSADVIRSILEGTMDAPGSVPESATDEAVQQDSEELPAMSPVLERGSRSGSHRSSEGEGATSAGLTPPSEVVRAVPTANSKAQSENRQTKSIFPQPVAFSYDDVNLTAMAWNSDGSLWINGEKREDGFGKSAFPIEKFGVVSVRVDRSAQTVSFYVNGSFVGTAFGPKGSGAAVEFPLCDVSADDDPAHIVYPAASVSTFQQSVRLRASGFHGSVVLPTILHLQKTSASVIGRLASSLIVGPPLAPQEDVLDLWLKSPLFVGGLDPSMSAGISELKESQINWRSSWDVFEVQPGKNTLNFNASLIVPSKESKPLSIPVTPGVISVSMDWLDGIMFCPDEFKSDADKLIVKMSLLTSGFTLDSACCALSRRGTDIDWSSCQEMQLQMRIDCLLSPLKLGFDLSVDSDDKTVSICSTLIDISCELALDKAIGLYFVPVQPKGVITVSVDYTPVVSDNVKIKESGEKDNKASITGSTIEIFVDGPISSMPVGILEDIADVTSSNGTIFLEWLERISPEPAWLRQRLEKSGSYSFPLVERPLVACLLKHGALVQEAELVLSRIRIGKDVVIDDAAIFTASSMPLPTPSSDMVSLWKRVQQFRSQLRTRRQKFKEAEVTILSATEPGERAKTETAYLDGDISASITIPVATLTPRLVCASGEHEMVVSDYMDGDYAGGWTCNICRVSGTDERWFCAECEDDYCFACHPRVLTNDIVVVESNISEEVAAASPAEFFVSQRLISWQIQPESAKSAFTARPASYYCEIKAVGIDKENEVGYVSFHAHGDGSVGSLQKASMSKLLIGNLQLSSTVHQYDVELDNEIRGHLRYDLYSVNLQESSTWKFIFGENGYETVEITPPDLNNIGGYVPESFEVFFGSDQTSVSDAKKSNAPNSFDELCAVYRSKIVFLLQLTPAGSDDTNSSENSKSLLLNLMDKYADISSGGTKLVRWRSDEGHSKWKNMVEFLRVHTKLRRQVSSERMASAVDSISESGRASAAITDIKVESTFPETDDLACEDLDSMAADRELQIDDLTPSETAMQACTVFINFGAKSESEVESGIAGSQETLPTVSAVEGLYFAMRKRAERAQLRIFGISAINEVLNMDSITIDPFAVQEILMFLRTSFDSDILTSADREKRKKEVIKSPRRTHYLVNLEGCNASTLACVQGSFLEMYSSLLVLLQEYLFKWKFCSEASDRVHSVLNLPIVPDLSRGASMTRGDALEAFLKRERLGQVYLGPIKYMMAAWSLHFSGRDHRFLLQSNVITSLQRIFSLSEYEHAVVDWMKAAEALTTYTEEYEPLFSDAMVSEKFVLWPSQYVQLGLKYGTVSCRAILLCICRLPLSVLPETDLEMLGLQRSKFLENCKTLSSADVSMLYEQVSVIVVSNVEKRQAEVDAEKVKDAVTRTKYDKELRSHLKDTKVPYFDKKHKHDDVILSGGDTVATSEITKSASDFSVRAVFCDVEYNFVRGGEKTGNYFEVTLLEIGDRDIGIGFAVRGTFPTKGEMPGWVDHSYGLHGDDGRRFGGSGSVSEPDWPVWNKNDIVGCGINFEDRSIFYTVNGVFLGKGFLEVGDDALHPVVGFHCATKVQSVRINFGIYPFHYSGTEIQTKGHPRALAQRQWFADWRTTHMLSLACPALFLEGDGIIPPPDLSRVLSGGSESSGPSSHYDSLHWEEKTEDGLQESKENISEDTLPQGKIIPHCIEEYRIQLRDLERAIEISSEHIVQFCSLQRYSDALLRFLLVASNTLTSSSDNSAFTSAKMPQNNQFVTAVLDVDDLPDIADLPAPALTKGRSTFGTPKHITAQDGSLLQESILAVIIQDIMVGSIYLSYACSGNQQYHYLLGALNRPPPASISLNIIMSRLPEFLTDTGVPVLSSTLACGHSNNEIDIGSTGSVEVGEIERTLFEHLTTLLGLCAVMKSLQEELSRSICLKAFLILLRVGTPRLQNATYRILLLCLPSVGPDVVDVALHQELWRDTVMEKDEDVSEQEGTPTNKNKRKSAARHMPDNFIKGLLCSIRNAVSAANSTISPFDYGHMIVDDKSSSEAKPADIKHDSHGRGGEVIPVANTPDIALEEPADVERKKKRNLSKKVSFNKKSNEPGFMRTKPKDRVILQSVPFGFGDVAIDRADEYINLIQRLFEAPAWTEVVACALTDGLREAVTILKRINSDKIIDESFSPQDVTAIQQACAVCAVLCGLGSFYTGARVEQSDGTQGKIVCLNPLEGTADILAGDYLTSIGCCGFSSGSIQYIETVPITTLKPQCDGVKVVLGELSQPLIQLLTALIKQCLLWLKKNVREGIDRTKFFTDSSMASQLSRLNALLSNAFSVVLEQQYCSIAEIAQDQSLISDIISVSLLPGGLEIFPSLSEVSRMWLFAQSRSLECNGLKLNSTETEKDLSIIDVEETLANEKVAEGENELQSSITLTAFHPHPLLLHTVDNGWACDGRTACPEGCKSNCSGFNQSSGWTRYRCTDCDFDLCGKCVSHYSPPIKKEEVADAKGVAESPQIASEAPECDSTASGVCLFTPTDGLGVAMGYAERVTIAMKMKEIYSLTNFGMCLSILEYFMCDEKKAISFFESNNDEVKKMDDEWSSAKSGMKFHSKCSIEPENALKQIDAKLATGSAATSAASRILGAPSETIDIDISGPLMSLSACELYKVEKSKSAGKSSGEVLLSVGSAVCYSDMEGPSAITGLNVGRSIVVPTSTSGSAIVSYYDRDLGTSFCERHRTSGLRKLTSYYERNVDMIPQFCSQIDVALTILRMRNITGKLLAEGIINFNGSIDNVKDWLGLLKLSCTNVLGAESGSCFNTSWSTAGGSSSKMADALAPLCNALLATSSSYPSLDSGSVVESPEMKSLTVENDIINILTGDVLRGFDLLMDTSNISDPTVSCLTDHDISSESQESFSIFASVHPVIPEHDVAGSIKYPSNWKGAVVSFDDKCAIPESKSGSDATSGLHFYKNIASTSKKAIYSFSGDMKKSDNYHSFIVDKEPICFKYVNKKSTAKSRMGIKSIYGSAKAGADGEYMGFNDLFSLSSTAEFQRGSSAETSLTGFQMIQRKRYELSTAELGSSFKDFCKFSSVVNYAKEATVHVKLLFPESSTLSIADSSRLGNGISYFEVRVDTNTKFRRNYSASEKVSSDAMYSATDAEKSDLLHEIGSGRASSISDLIFEANTKSMVGFVDMSDKVLFDRARNSLPAADHVISCCFLDSKSRCIIARGIEGSEFLEYFEETMDDIGYWEPGDTIGCLFEKSLGQARVRFSRNGHWGKKYIKTSVFPRGAHPAMCIRNSIAFQPNFGNDTSKFSYPPLCYSDKSSEISDGSQPLIVAKASTDAMSPSVTRGEEKEEFPDSVKSNATPIPDTESAGPEPIAMKTIDFFGELNPRNECEDVNKIIRSGSIFDVISTAEPVNLKSSVQSKLLNPTALSALDTINWGYRFKVQELKGILVRVIREFDVVWKSDVKDFKSNAHIYIWKPANIPTDYVSCNQIATTSPKPPIGGIILHKSQCKPPISFKQIFTSQALKCTVWRAIPPSGYVSMGDVVMTFSSGSASSHPPSEAYQCVPLWAVITSRMGPRLLKCDKGGEKSKPHKFSFWSIRSEMGAFMGSANEDPVKVSDVYRLNTSVYNIIQGEWVNESDALKLPSFSWTSGLIEFLLSNKRSIEKVLSGPIFERLANYLQCSSSVNRLRVVPLLIKMIRLSKMISIPLPYDMLDGACKAILKEASTKATKDKFLGDGLLSLVDLVVEVTSAHLTTKQGSLSSSAAARPSREEPLNYFHRNEIIESKEEIGDGLESKEDDLPTLGQIPVAMRQPTVESLFTKKCSSITYDEWASKCYFKECDVYKSLKETPMPWWDYVVPDEEKNKQRLTVQATDMDKLMLRKVSILYRLRQIIGCLRALGAGNNDFDIGIKSSLPFGLLMKAWFDHVSSCVVEETAHPYLPLRRSYKKRIFFPGATSLTIVFDSRCSLNTALLKLTSGGEPKSEGGKSTPLFVLVLKGGLTGNWPLNAVNITGNYVDVEFMPFQKLQEENGSSGEVAGETDENMDSHWGWSFVVHANGSIFESASTQFELPDAIEDLNINNVNVLPPCDGLNNAEISELKISSPKLFSCGADDSFDILISKSGFSIQRGEVSYNGSDISYDSVTRRYTATAHIWKYDILFSDDFCTIDNGRICLVPSCNCCLSPLMRSTERSISFCSCSDHCAVISKSIQPEENSYTCSLKNDQNCCDLMCIDCYNKLLDAHVVSTLGTGKGQLFYREIVKISKPIADFMPEKLHSSPIVVSDSSEPSASFPAVEVTNIQKKIMKSYVELAKKIVQNNSEKQKIDKGKAAATKGADFKSIEYNDLVFVATMGNKVASGTIGVPNASSFELNINRPNPRPSSLKSIYVLHLKFNRNNEVCDEYIKVETGKVQKTVQSSIAEYAMYALRQDLIPSFDTKESALKEETSHAEAATIAAVTGSSLEENISSKVDIGDVVLKADSSDNISDPLTIGTLSDSVPVGECLVSDPDVGFGSAMHSDGPEPALSFTNVVLPLHEHLSVTPTTTLLSTDEVLLDYLPSSESVSLIPTEAIIAHDAATVPEDVIFVPTEAESATWACTVCTFLNEISVDSCQMCTMPRSDATGVDEEERVPTRAVDSPSGPAGVAAWWCPRCTFMNPLTSSNCEMCGGPSGGPVSGSVPAATESPEPTEEHPPDDDEDHSEDNEDQDEDEEEDDEEDEDEDEEDEEEAEEPFSLFGEEEPAASPAEDAVAEGSAEAFSDPKLPKLTKLASSETRSSPELTSSAVDTIVVYPPDVVILSAIASKISHIAKCETRLEQSIISGSWTPLEFMQRMFYNWDSGTDSILIDFLDSQKSIKKVMEAVHTVVLPRQFMEYKSQGYSRFNLLEVQSRILIFSYFNQHLEELLPVINLRNPDAHSLGAMIRQRSRYVFSHVKQPMLDAELEATATSSGPGIPATFSLDNMKSTVSQDRGEIDPSTSNCCFVQAFRELKGKDSNIYRHIFSGDRVFQIQFVGESGIDAGGVFREGVMRMVEDLFSDYFNLLLMCPNGIHSVHINMEKYVPNPKHTSTLALQMFEFMGKLMGMSLRVKLCLPFELPSLVWKQLVGEELVLDDLMAIDSLTCKYLDAVQNCAVDGIADQESFSAKYQDRLKFVYTGSDGVERELVKGGRNILVSYDTRMEYARLVVSARLSEFTKQVAAIARGMAEVVPMRVLQLYSWQQLETLVVGSATFDIEMWKKHTDASGISNKCLALFWKVMESLTTKEQAGFVRFAWGRSRLPAAKDFKTKMKLTPAGRAPLPIAHTCFFSIELPDYPTEEKMRHGLLTAIHFGAGGILMG